MTSRDKGLLLAILSVGLVTASYVGLANPLRTKTEELRQRQEELKQDYENRQAVLSRRDEYLQSTGNYNDAYEMMLERFPGGISQDQQILFVTMLEDRFNTRITSVSYTDAGPIYEFQSVEPGNTTPYRLLESVVEIPVQVDYSQWKELIDFIFTYEDKNTVPKIMAQYDAASGLVNANIILKQYGISGENRAFDKKAALAPVGTDNLFTSGVPVAYDGTMAAQLEEIKKQFDCYLMLYPVASDVTAKVMAGAEDKEKVTSEQNTEETLLIEADTREDGSCTLRYTLGNLRPRILTGLTGDSLDIYVLSTPRSGDSDQSGVKVTVENRTDKKLRFAVAGEDAVRPRFVIESQTGDVEVLK